MKQYQEFTTEDHRKLWAVDAQHIQEKLDPESFKANIKEFGWEQTLEDLLSTIAGLGESIRLVL